MASWGPGRVDLFFVGSDSSLNQYAWNGQWSFYDFDQPNGYVYDPVAISRATNEYDIFLVNSDHSITYTHWDGTAWEQMNLGGFTTNVPAITSRSNNSIDIFIIDEDHEVLQNTLSGDAWSGFKSLGDEPGLSFQDLEPAAVSCNTDHIQVLAVAEDSSLMTKKWTSTTGWQAWKNTFQDEIYTSGPSAVCGREVDTIDTLILGTDSSLYVQTSTDTGSTWKKPVNLGGQWVFRPHVVSWEQGYLDVFVVGGDSAVYNYRFDGQWQDAVFLNGFVIKPPTALVLPGQGLKLWVIGGNGLLAQKDMDGITGTWSPSATGSWEGVGDQMSFSRIGGFQ